MTEWSGYMIIGNANRGGEYIYPYQIWEPTQIEVQGSTVYFTHLMKGVSDDAKLGIKRDGGFKGNFKKYGEDENGYNLSRTFSWWSVYVDEDNAERIRREARDRDQEPGDIYMGGTRYGTNLFAEKLDTLIRKYEYSIQGPSEIRVLATFEYKREVQHALVVVPKNDKTFQTHQLVAEREENGIYRWKQERIVKPVDDNGHYGNDHDDYVYSYDVYDDGDDVYDDEDHDYDDFYYYEEDGDIDDSDADADDDHHDYNDYDYSAEYIHGPAYLGDMPFPSKPDTDAGYVWFPFSTVKWDNNARPPPKQRQWAHLAFAFYLDPIPDKMMRVPEVDNGYKWMACTLQDVDLTTELYDQRHSNK